MKTLLSGSEPKKFFSIKTDMDGEVKGETDQIVLNANPVEAVALTYESERVLVKYQKVGPNARTPRRGSAQAAGYDVYSTTDREIPPEETVHFPVELITKPEPGWCLKLYNRSSLAAKKLVAILGAPMIVDPDYRGIVIVPLHNFSREKSYRVKKGDRIGQVLIERCYKIYWEHDEHLQETEPTARGSGGFGSTGR